MSRGERVLVFWVPDWPVHAHTLEHTEDQSDTLPPTVALSAQHRIVACSVAARAAGVRAGLREREAQTRCPDLAILPHNPKIDGRRFAPVLAAIEQLVPGVEARRPGLCAMRVRGPARYYGGEEPASVALLTLAAELGLAGARVGIADGLFAAEQAARAASTAQGVTAPRDHVRIVAPGMSAAFLSGLPIERAAPAEFAEVLHGLGIRTLGAFAALPEDAVRQRFGSAGITVHRRATATGPVHGAEVRPRAPVREFSAELSFEPPVDTAEQLGFACVTLAERFIASLTEERLVCTALRIELTDDRGVRHEREWAHPHRFTATDTVGRVRWQAATISEESDRGGAGITHVRITPTHTDRAAAHEPGLWNTEPTERVHHHLSRAQSRLGHAAVGTASLTGGRLLADRQRFVPWGTTRSRPAAAHATAHGPWPGALTGPPPSQVFPAPIPVALLGPEGTLVGVDSDDFLTSVPSHFQATASAPAEPITRWSQAWPLREKWWHGTPPRVRLQVLLAGGDAWLVYAEAGAWFAEGRYD